MPDFSAMPEVFVSNADLAAAVSREVKGGTLRKIGSRLYTRNLKDASEQIVLRNLWPLVAAYLPGALIADRTALEYRPAPDGSVFLVADHKRDIVLPGVILRPRKGAPALAASRCQANASAIFSLVTASRACALARPPLLNQRIRILAEGTYSVPISIPNSAIR